jgi:hypothetical protein
MAERPRCGAHARSTGKPCRSTHLGAGGRCRAHGGASPTGVASPHFKHGGRSSYLPGGLAARVQQAMADPQLRGMRLHLAMLDVRISDVAHELEGQRPAWTEAREAFAAFKAAQAANDPDSAIGALNRLDQVLESGVDESKIWRELREVIRDRDRLLTGEATRLERLSQTMSVSQAMQMVVALAGAVREIVTDPAQRRELQRRMQTTLGVSAYRAGAVPPVIDTAAEEAGNEQTR